MATRYATWKKIVWRYARVFLAAFISAIAVDQLFFGDADAIRTILRSAFAAGLAAIAKYLREGEKYDSYKHKIPV